MSTRNILPADPPVLLTGANPAVVDPGGGSSGSGTVSAGVYYDWLINGTPFLIWPEQDDPYIRDTKEDVKDQFDSSREAGEQSFGYWWLRSQATYAGGAGQAYLDTGTADVNRTRFYSSNFINPFTSGKATVNDTFTSTAGSRSDAVMATWSSIPKLITGSSAANTITVASLPNLTSSATITVGTGGTVQALATDGENVYVAINDKVYRVKSDSTVTQVAAVSFVGPISLGVAKARVILTTGPKVYEVDPTGVAAATLIYTNPSSNWRYTSVADGPNGIYLSGYLGPQSELSLMDVKDSGTGITLGQPVVQLRTPPGEIINQCVFYLNSFFGLATSNGMRIGTFTPYGQAQYGPLLNAGNPTYSAVGSGSLIYFGGNNTIWAVDLGTQVDTGRYAYACYGAGLVGGGGNVTSLDVYVPGAGDRLFALLSTGALLSQTDTAVKPTVGTLVTSWARFGTVEPKRLHYVRVEGVFPTIDDFTYPMSVTVESITGQTQTFNVPGGKTFYEFGVSSFSTAEAYRLTFNLHPAATLRSWQLKTRPAPTQFQEFILPLGCWDHEIGADGQQTGYPGYAMDRLLKLEASAKANAIVTAQDRWSNTQYQAQITRCQFRQSTMPGRTDRNGGKVTLVLRLV